jgi:hypothetical protein
MSKLGGKKKPRLSIETKKNPMWWKHSSWSVSLSVGLVRKPKTQPMCIAMIQWSAGVLSPSL